MKFGTQYVENLWNEFYLLVLLTKNSQDGLSFFEEMH